MVGRRSQDGTEVLFLGGVPRRTGHLSRGRAKEVSGTQEVAGLSSVPSSPVLSSEPARSGLSSVSGVDVLHFPHAPFIAVRP